MQYRELLNALGSGNKEVDNLVSELGGRTKQRDAASA